VEGLHAVGDLFIKHKCQLCVKLCVVLLFMHLFLWVFPVYDACVFLLLFYMNLCIFKVFVCFNLVSKFIFFFGIA
jgi:hypothetical protein